jgi:hypothetical protein
MKAKLISYDLSELPQWKKVEINRKLFGYTEFSNHSKYRYKREGILKNIPHIKIAKSVIIIKETDFRKIIKNLKCKYKLLTLFS